MFMAIACVAASAQTAAAQAKSSGGGSFGLGSTDIGPVVGLGGIGGAGASFGGRFEHGFKALPDLGNGILGIQVAADYYSWSSGSGLFNYSFKYIPVGVTANYHFKLDEPKIDPFIGLGLGYNIISCSYDGSVDVGCGSYNSAIYFIGRVGARYYFSPKMAVYGDAGAGGATLNLGIMFKM
ncbi:MAG: outer membrane beta-barrel protein [bacterium]